MKGLNKTFPGGKQVLKDIWLSFLPGAKIGVLGLNGAGKSSLLKIMKPWYPAELFCAEETASVVSSRWSEYFPQGRVEMGDSARGHLD